MTPEESIKISYIKPKTKGGCKITVHKTGRLGFSKAAARLMSIGEKNIFCMIGRNKKQPNNNCLYLQLSSEENDYTYKISKSGMYYYIKANELLKEIGVNYEDEDVTTIYDVSIVSGKDNILYKLKKRIIKTDKR